MSISGGNRRAPVVGDPPPAILDVARAYRRGELSPVEVTRSCLQRIDELDAEIHAFVTVTADRALARARAAQAQVRDDPDLRRPLLGIPVAVKDIVDVAGVETRAGSAALAGRTAPADATVWRRLDAAGAVLLGKTATHELAYGVATPPTRNPWDTTRMPGGSSGGSAAALAAGMCLGAVGTDTGGSIRIPAGLCGVVGLKPTRGLCPTDGILPLSPTLDHVGPMACSARDAAALLDGMAGGRTGWDVVEPAGLRVGLARTDALMSPDVGRAFARVTRALESAGAEIEPVAVPSFHDAARRVDRIVGVEAGVVHADLLASAGERLGAAVRAKLQSAARVDGPTYYRAIRHAGTVRAGYEAALANADVLLAPGVASTAPTFGADAVAVNGEQIHLGRALCWNTAALNLAGLPTVALPAGVATDGLPVGVQLIGAAGSDARLLAIAESVTRHTTPAQ